MAQHNMITNVLCGVCLDFYVFIFRDGNSNQQQAVPAVW
jgi:hypothetical protein